MSRSRQPRVNNNKDPDEERRLWQQIKADAKKIDGHIERQREIGNEILTIETKQADLIDTDKLSDAALDDRLEVLYRENVRLSEVIQHSIEGKSDEVNLLDNIRILHALRESVNEEVISQDLGHTHRSGSTTGGPKHRATSLAKRKFNASTPSGEDIDDSSHSITHSPRGPRLNTSSRDKSLRAGSATPSFREASVKLEDGDSEISSLDGVDHEGMDLSELGSAAGTTGVRNNIPTSSVNSMANVGQAGSSTPLNGQRQFLAEGSFVLYRTKGRPQDGEGMVCRVTSVIGDGKQRRYEIQDTEPDPRNGTGIQQPYRASVNHLIPIPENNFGLSDLAKGKNVLAQYPDTTTFYKAEVSTPWKAKDMTGSRGTYVRLRFEGELEEATETEVERRFVVLNVK